MTTVIVNLPEHEHKCGMKDFELLGETEESLMERAAKLKERHERLMEECEWYRELHDSLPDRSDFHSGVPVTQPVVSSTFQTLKNINAYKRDKLNWKKKRSTWIHCYWTESKERRPAKWLRDELKAKSEEIV